MSVRSGALAAAKRGVAVSGGVQIGPRGGKFYINSAGKKVYGEPPKAAPTARVPAPPTKTTPPREIDKGQSGVPAKPIKSPGVPSHITRGGKVWVDLGDKGWASGKVQTIGKDSGVSKVRLDRGGLVEAKHQATQSHEEHERAVRREGSSVTLAPTKPPEHNVKGGRVQVHVDGKWESGTVSRTYKTSVNVKLDKGGTAKALHHETKPEFEEAHVISSTTVKPAPPPVPPAHKPQAPVKTPAKPPPLPVNQGSSSSTPRAVAWKPPPVKLPPPAPPAPKFDLDKSADHVEVRDHTRKDFEAIVKSAKMGVYCQSTPSRRLKRGVPFTMTAGFKSRRSTLQETS